jgi:hypothetical protein
MVTSLFLVGITVDIEPVEKGRYDLGVELRTEATAYFGNGILHVAPPPVREVRNHIVERLSHRHDSRSQRDFFPFQVVGVTAVYGSVRTVV